MEYSELKAMDEAGLTAYVAQQRSALHALRFRLASKQAKNVREYRALRRTIAQALTLLTRHRSVAASAREARTTAAPAKGR